MIQRLQAKRGEEGFTLIELLIVIIILAILAAIVIFAVGTTRKDSVTSACTTNAKSIVLSAEAVNTKVGTYPATGTIAADGNGENLIAPATGALLKSWPTSADYSFTYAQTGSGTGFTLTIPGTANVTGGTITNLSADPAIATACAGK